MKKAITILTLLFCVNAFAQQEIRLYDGVAPEAREFRTTSAYNAVPTETYKASQAW